MNGQRQRDSSVKRHAEETLESLVIKHRIIENKGRPTRTLSYVSKSHAFSSMVFQNRISFGHDFFFDLADPLKSTDAFQSDGPDPSKDENKTHHPYFLGEMKKLVESAVKAGRTIHQQLFWSKDGHWLKLDDGVSAGVEPDFCTTDSIPNGELVASAKGKAKPPQSKYDVAIAFEQKKKFVNSDQMEIVDYGERILCIQRGRTCVYTALFHCALDDKTIRWAETMEIDEQFVTKISKPASLLPGEDGQRQLLTMLSKSSFELGRVFPKIDQPVDGGHNLKVLYCVGEGATSTVFAARLENGQGGGVDGVIKVMKHTFHHLVDHEKSIMDHLSESGMNGLLKCTKVADFVLFFDKLLRPFVGTFSVDKVAAMLDCLKSVHAAGVVHRDIRPENILEDATGNLYLIDWGFALSLDTRMDPPPPFEGTFRYGSEAVVNAAHLGMKHHYTPKDDLEAFVKTVVAVNSGERRILRKISAIEPGDFGTALQVWSEERQLRVEYFSGVFEAASTLDYAKLKRLLVF